MMSYNNLKILKNSKNVCIICHADPDTDALASEVLVEHFIKQKYPNVNVDLFADHRGLPDNYTPIIDGYSLNPIEKTYDTAIMVDCPNIERLGKFKYLFDNASLTIVFDHHATNMMCGTLNFVDNISSTCQLLYKIFNSLKYKFTDKDYSLIYAGIITDTNNFSVGNIDSETFEQAAVCENHINRANIYENFFSNNTLKNMQILALSINNIKQYVNGKLQISHIAKEDELRLNIEQKDYLGIVNKLASISPNKITALIYPKENEYFISLRAKRGFDVSATAKKYGGGGHVGASGFISSLDIEKIENLLIEEFKNQLEEIPDEPYSLF